MQYEIGPGAIVLGEVATACVIGAGAVIYPGVRIGRGACIDPGCVVKRDIPAFSVVSCEGAFVSGVAPRELSLITDELIDRTQTRAAGDYEAAFNMAKRLANYLPYMGFDSWGPLYEMCAGLLFNDGAERTADSIGVLTPLLSGILESPLSSCEAESKGVAFLMKHAASGAYEPWARMLAVLDKMEPCLVFVHGNARKKEAAIIEGMGHSLISIKGSVSEKVHCIRQLCESREIGVLISDHYGAVPSAVFKLRSAPRQWFLSDGVRWMPCDSIVLPEANLSSLIAAI